MNGNAAVALDYAPPPTRGEAVASAVRRQGFRFSLVGLSYACMMMFMGLAAINTQANLLFAVFGLMLGVLLVAGWISRRVLLRLDVERLLPDTAVVGRPAQLAYALRNRKRFWPSLSVTVEELEGHAGLERRPLAYLLHVAGGASATVGAELVPRRRGVHRFGAVQLSTSFPFGFVRRAATAGRPDALLAFPPLAEVSPDLLRRFRSAENVGQNLRPRLGAGDEFYGLKEYRPGENPRQIYWRRSARVGELVVKQTTRIAPPRVLVAVDHRPPTADDEGRAAVERAIAVAASLVDAAEEAGLAVGLVADDGRGGLVRLRPGRGKRHRRELLTALATLGLGPTRAGDGLLREALPLVDSAATPVLVTPGTEWSVGSKPGRSQPAVLGARSAEAAAAFRFAADVDFAKLVPALSVATNGGAARA